MSSSSRRRVASPPRGGLGKLRMDRQPIVTRISGELHFDALHSIQINLSTAINLVLSTTSISYLNNFI